MKLTWTMITTITLLLSSLAVLAAWNIYAVLNSTKGDTISEIVLLTSTSHPLVPLAIGVVCGHWFVPGQQFFTAPQQIAILSAIAVLTIVLSLVHLHIGLPGGEFLRKNLVIFLVVGLLIGGVVWPMSRPA